MKRLAIFALLVGLSSNGVLSISSSALADSQLHASGPTLALGDQNICAIDTDGYAHCWGHNYGGQSDVPADLGRVTQIASGGAGTLHSCALTVAGKVRCWGLGQPSYLNTPDNLGFVTQLAVGAHFNCAITSPDVAPSVYGKVRCWGEDTYGQVDVPSNLGTANQIAIYGNHVCALTWGIRCWGQGDFTYTGAMPWWLGSPIQIVPGESKDCALLDSGRIICWSQGGYSFSNPIPDFSLKSQLIIIRDNPCFTTASGSLGCWEWSYKFFYSPYPWQKFTSQLQTDYWQRICGIGDNGSIQCVNLSDAITLPSDFRVLQLPSEENQLSVTTSSVAKEGTQIIATAVESNSAYTIYFQWLKNGAAIQGANSDRYTPGIEDLGANISVRVSAVNYRTGFTATSDPLQIPHEVPNSNCATDYDTSNWQNTKLQPSLVGIIRSGQTLRSFNGIWSEAVSYCTYWLLDKQVIQGVKNTYKLTDSAVGKQIQFVVVGTDKSGTSLLRYSSSATVQNSQFQNPKAPAIYGTAMVGQSLKAVFANWAKDTTYTYQWSRNGQNIDGATAVSYTPVAQDAGDLLTVTTCGSKQFVDALCLTSLGIPISLGVIRPVGTVSILGSGKVGNPVVGVTSNWMNGLDLEYQWLLDGAPIPNETGLVHYVSQSESGHNLRFQVTASTNGYQPLIKTSIPKKLP